jgi:hypothetical protein
MQKLSQLFHRPSPELGGLIILASDHAINSVFALYHSPLNELWCKSKSKVIALLEAEK